MLTYVIEIPQWFPVEVEDFLKKSDYGGYHLHFD